MKLLLFGSVSAHSPLETTAATAGQEESWACYQRAMKASSASEVRSLQRQVEKLGNVHDMFLFALDVKGADKASLVRAISKSTDRNKDFMIKCLDHRREPVKKAKKFSLLNPVRSIVNFLNNVG
jgi:hypothetical protein